MPPVRRLAVLLTCLALAAGCTKDAPPRPDEDPNEAARQARGRLAVLAQATANGAYDATYSFVQRETKASGVIRIRQRPPQYRIDVLNADDTASFFALENGFVSCSRNPKKKTCFLVARPNEQVPALFDPGVQRLFRDAVSDLATNPTAYTVTVVPPPTPTASPSPSASPSASSATPAPSALGECFQVTKTEAVPTPTGRGGFENGTYCFSEERGVATLVDVASGTLTLTKVGAAPGDKAFEPITKVLKLPELTPTPTPTRKKK
jgi:hypothetical protein